jgi:hypothetical protein
MHQDKPLLTRGSLSHPVAAALLIIDALDLGRHRLFRRDRLARLGAVVLARAP